MTKRTLASAVVVAFAASTLYAKPEKPQSGPERDDPNARRRAMRQWYETPFTAAYKKHLNNAASKERGKYGVEAFQGTSEAEALALEPATELVASGSAWTNIGPTSSAYIQNGGYSLNKSDSGRVTEIVVDHSNPSTVYVAMSGGGVWKTTNSGTNWAPKTESLGSLSTGALEMDPANASVLYLGLGDSFDGTGIGLVKSTDGGDTWGAPVYLGASTIINKIQVSRTDSNVVLVATDKGMFRSTNAGASFAGVSVATGNAATPYAWDLAWAGGSNYVMSLEANPAATSGTTDGQVWRSVNDGASWTRATGVTKTGGVGRISLAVSPANQGYVYAMAAVPLAASATDLADFFRSTNGGASFSALGATGRKVRYTNSNTESTGPGTVLNGQSWYNHMLIADPNVATTFYFGGALLMGKAALVSNAYKYTQLTNWLAQFSLPYVHADFHAAAFGADGTFWVGSDGGVFKSTNGGTSWTDVNQGITSHLFYSVGSTLANENAVIGGLQDNGTRVRVGTSGVYNQEIGGDGFGSHIHPTNANLMLGSLYYSRIQKSTDGGLNFVSACSGITECNNSSTAPFNTKITPYLGDASGNTLYTHSNSKVYRTTNYATSWVSTGATFASGIYLRNVGVASSSNNYVGVVASGGRTYLSTNGGASFGAEIQVPNNGLSMSMVSFEPNAGSTNGVTVYVSSVAPDATKNHLWKSTTYGATWTKLDRVQGEASNGLPIGVPVNSINAANGVLYAGTHLGIYSSTDGGATWSRFGTGLPLVNVTDLYVAPNGSFLRAATFGRGIWEMR